jgi:predicted DNA-binding protein
MKRKGERRKVSVDLPIEIIERLDFLAQRAGLSRAAAINYLLDVYVEPFLDVCVSRLKNGNPDH